MAERPIVITGARKVDGRSHVAQVGEVIAKIVLFHAYDDAAEAAFRGRRFMEAAHLDGLADQAVGFGAVYSRSELSYRVEC